jgi:single-strand DNA-binding protein
VTIVGNMTRDAELRFTSSGTAVASFGVVFNKRTKNGDKWEDGDPQFFDVTCWRSLAENVAESLEKGTRVVVTGRLEYQTWEKDGDKRSKVQIVADEVGPSLRWATAEVSKTERSDRSVAAQNAKTVQEAFDPGEEPF